MNLEAGTAVRDRIVRAAQRLFATKGFSATSLREVALAAGVTKPMVYYYFGSKDGLYQSLLDIGNASFRRALEAAIDPQASCQANLIEVLRSLARFARGQRDTLQFLLSSVLGPRNASPTPGLNSLTEIQRGINSTLLAVGSQQQGFRSDINPKIISRIFQGAISVFVSMAINNDPNLDDPALAEQIVQALWTGIGKT